MSGRELAEALEARDLARATRLVKSEVACFCGEGMIYYHATNFSAKQPKNPYAFTVVALHNSDRHESYACSEFGSVELEVGHHLTHVADEANHFIDDAEHKVFIDLTCLETCKVSEDDIRFDGSFGPQDGSRKGDFNRLERGLKSAGIDNPTELARELTRMSRKDRAP